MDVLLKKILVTSEGEEEAKIKSNRAVIIFEKPLHFTKTEDLEELKTNLLYCFDEIFNDDAKVLFKLPENIIPDNLD